MIGLREYNQAIDYIERAAKLYPGNSEVLYTKGNYFFFLRRYDEALQCFDEALKNPHDEAQIMNMKSFNQGTSDF